MRVAPSLASLLVVTAFVLPACEKDAGPETLGGETDGVEDSAGADTDGEPGPDAGVGFEACPEPWQARSCGDDAQVQYCDFIEEADEFVWGPCLTKVACEPGTERPCANVPNPEPCILDEGVPRYDDLACVEEPEGSTPLVLVPRGKSVAYAPAGASTFDTFSGECLNHDWPTADTPWLALDRDHSGFIEDGRELFGSGTFLATGERARNGFDALAEFDRNRDGVIDRKDPVFAKLVLWADENGDRRSSPSELSSLSSAGVRRIPLAYEKDLRCDGRGNCEFERVSTGRTAAIVDIHLACR